MVAPMSLRTFVTTFGTVFLAELGDKTQLGALALSSTHASKWTVFIAASLALVVSTAIAVALGDRLLQVVPLIWIKRASGIVFIVLGVLTLWGARRGDPSAQGQHETRE